MNTWFLCKAKYQKIDESGKEKMVSEEYLFDAMSFTEAESRVNNELKPFVNGEFFVAVIKIANFSELIPNEDGDRWFKSQVAFVTLDEEKGVEKKTKVWMLVQANNVKEAYENIELALSDTVSDFEIPQVMESPIVDIFTYFPEEPEPAEKTGED